MEGWDLATFALVLLVFSAVARRLEGSVVTAAIFFTSAGLLAGPVLGLIDLSIRAEPVKLLAEATLTLVLFADASRISLPALRQEFAVPLRLLATIVFAVILIDESSLPHEQTMLLAVVATIAISVYAHGLSSRPLTDRYVSWYASHDRVALPAMESVPAAEHRWQRAWPDRVG